MSANEAKILAAILLTADGGCSDCGGKLIELAITAWPAHRQVFIEAWNARWPQYPWGDK